MFLPSFLQRSYIYSCVFKITLKFIGLTVCETVKTFALSISFEKKQKKQASFLYFMPNK